MKSIFDTCDHDTPEPLMVPGTAFVLVPLAQVGCFMLLRHARIDNDTGDRLFRKFAGRPVNRRTLRAIGMWLARAHVGKP